MRKLLAGLLLLSLASQPALTQQPVFTVPQPASTLGGNASGTLGTGFQQIWGSTNQQPGNPPSRKGCTIVNEGSHSMFVTEGLSVDASTTALAVLLAAGQAYYCAGGGTVLTGEINISGTSGDPFYAAQY